MIVNIKYENEDEKEFTSDLFETVKKQKVEETTATYQITSKELVDSVNTYVSYNQGQLEQKRMQEGKYYRTHDLVVDSGQHRVIKNQKEILLTPSSWAILDELILHNGNIVTRDCLKFRLEQTHFHPISDNLLNVEMRRLRKKLDESSENSYISSVYGVGYRWKHVIIAE